KAGTGVVVTIDPAKREKVRELPQKENGKQDRGAGRERSTSRRPPAEDWKRTRHCADERREGRAPLERRVHEHVGNERHRGERRGERIGERREIRDTERSHRPTE